MNELRSAKLTKKFLMSLPKGIYLMSNLVGQDRDSVFREYVLSPLSEREKQWQKIKLAGADNCLCRLFKTEDQAINWIEEIK
jgi:hypothetical protein